MELNHEVVKDLYPLYIENELSPAVKKAIESHLQECENCKRTYDSGEGIFDRLKELDEPEVPKSVDEKLQLKIKVNRLKWTTLFLVGVILAILITNYKNDREKLFLALDQYYSTQRHLPSLLEIVKNEQYSDLGDIQEVVHRFFEDEISLTEYLNFIEKHNLEKTDYYLSLETSRFNKMLEIMQYRFDQGIWDKTDEAAYEAIIAHFKELNQVVTKEYEEMHHGYSSYIETLDVAEMEHFYKKVNLLSDSYTRYHKLPEELEPIEETTLKQQIAKALDIDADKIDLEKESPLNYHPYTYRINILDNYTGIIDGLNGQILEVHGNGDLTDGLIMSKGNAKKKAAEYIERIYGSDLNFELVSLGFNYNYTSNDPRFQVYSYQVVPVVNGFKLYSPFDQGTILHIDARTGELNMFHHNPNVPTFKGIKQTDLSIVETVEALNQKGFDVSETVIIYSALSGGFELAHMSSSLKDFEEGKFYSTKTGKEERIYYNEG